MAQEGKPISLEFTKPGSGGPYEEITWYKGSTGYSSNRIVLVHPDITGGQPLYYNDYCSGMSPCETSSKGELNITTGELTIYSIELTDVDYYYYSFYIEGGTADTGHKYEINLSVSGKKKQSILLQRYGYKTIDSGNCFYPCYNSIHFLAGCYTNSDSTQCSSGQICRNNICETGKRN